MKKNQISNIIPIAMLLFSGISTCSIYSRFYMEATEHTSSFREATETGLVSFLICLILALTNIFFFDSYVPPVNSVDSLSSDVASKQNRRIFGSLCVFVSALLLFFCKMYFCAIDYSPYFSAGLQCLVLGVFMLFVGVGYFWDSHQVQKFARFNASQWPWKRKFLVLLQLAMILVPLFLISNVWCQQPGKFLWYEGPHRERHLNE